MKKVVICPNPRRDLELKATQEALRILQGGMECVVSFPFTTNLDLSELTVPVVPLSESIKTADFLVCLGGDGTILHLAAAAAKCSLPLITANLGNLGFICELDASELNLLSKLADGEYTIEKRMMLEVSVIRNGKTAFNTHALNEAVLSRGAISRVINIRTTVNDCKLFDVRGDGLIVATATGSTGYSLSAGGPIIEPSLRGIVVTPICAHNVRIGSYVLSADDVVKIETVERGRNSGYLCVDGGKAFALRYGDRIELKRSPYETRLARLTDRSFYERCDKKLVTGGFRYEK